MKCNKCGCLVDEYYHSYKYNGLDYCCHCMLSVLVENTIVEDADIKIEEIPVEINCPECGFKGVAELDDKDHYAPIVECPKCGNKRISILNGKDCVVKNIVIEKPDDD